MAFLNILVRSVTQFVDMFLVAQESTSLTQLLRFILVFLANQRFVFLICFTVFYKF